jgi:hypothetical protein
MPLVTLLIKNDLQLSSPVTGVHVEFYGIDGLFQTTGVTDLNGSVTISLPDGTYDIGFYKPGVTILPKQPQRIVVDSLLTNSFLVRCHERLLPESSDPRKCRISGKIVGVDGGRNSSRLVVAPSTKLIVFDGNIVDLEKQTEMASDEYGYFEFDLLRKEPYEIYFLYLESFLGISPPAKLAIVVPDQPAIELHKLLFPVPVDATFLPALSVSLPLSATEDRSNTVSVLWNDNVDRWNSFAWAGVSIFNDNPLVADVSVSVGSITIKPLSPGVANISVKRLLPSIAHFDPIEPFISDTLILTVTP